MSDPISADVSRDASFDALDALLKTSAPAALVDDGFTAHTMAAIAREHATAHAAVAVGAHAAPLLAPLDAARALVLEQRRYAAQARLWRWAMAGVAVGALLVVAVVIAAPGGVAIPFDLDAAVLPLPVQWAPLWAVMTAGATWFAWRQWRWR